MALSLAWIGVWPLLRYLRHGSFIEAAGVRALDTAGIDTVVFGCLLALAARGVRGRERLVRWARSPIALPLTLTALLLLYGTIERWPLAWQSTAPLLRNIVITAAMWWCVANPDGIVGRALSWRPMALLGVLSYSLYLWQQMFLFPGHTAWICAFPQNLVATFTVALLSYFVIERPFHALRDRWASSRLPARDRGTHELAAGRRRAAGSVHAIG
jgi:peptidoglycan/LPS O-acetylase OafA/YrhL